MTRAVNTALAGSGGVLQVVQTVKTNVFSSNSTSFIAVTGFSASITPTSTSSKILVMYNCSMTNNNTTPWFSCFSVLYRDAIKIAYGDLRGSENQASTTAITTNAGVGSQISLIYLDSPATTNSVTYQVYGKTDSATYPFYVGGSAVTSSQDYGSTPSVITLLEIAG